MFRNFGRILAGFAALVALLLAMAPTALGASAPFTLRIPAVMVHRVQCDVPPVSIKNKGLFLCPNTFDAQLQLLSQQGWSTITAAQLADDMVSGTCPAPKTFVITIDDGALDGYTNGAPIMEKYGFTATFAMVAGKVGDYLTNPNLSKPHFSWDQARDLVVRGFDIANHTMDHVSIAKLSQAGLDREVQAAQDLFLQQLGFAPKVFVYPYGSVGKGTAPAYLSSRFELAFTDPGNDGAKNGAYESTADPMHAPRIRDSRSTTPAALLKLMKPFSNPCGSTN